MAVAYEAGPTGFGLYRALTAAGVRCVVVAPSKLQRPCGDRVKTDAKDAVHLARLLRLGEITAVTVPSVEQEAARDLVRAREDCRGDLMRARHRLSKLLLRQGIVYGGGTAWTGAHDRWLRQQRFGNPVTTTAFESDYEASVAITAGRDRLDKTGSTRRSPNWPQPVSSPRSCGVWACLRGVSTLTAFGLAVEIGDWTRFTGNSIGSFVGLVPSEHSSGASRVQGSITKTGTGHAGGARSHGADQRAISMVLATAFAADPVVRWLVPKAATFRCFEPLPVTWMPLPVARISGSSQKRV